MPLANFGNTVGTCARVDSLLDKLTHHACSTRRKPWWSLAWAPLLPSVPSFPPSHPPPPPPTWSYLHFIECLLTFGEQRGRSHRRKTDVASEYNCEWCLLLFTLPSSRCCCSLSSSSSSVSPALGLSPPPSFFFFLPSFFLSPSFFLVRLLLFFVVLSLLLIFILLFLFFCSLLFLVESFSSSPASSFVLLSLHLLVLFLLLFLPSSFSPTLLSQPGSLAVSPSVLFFVFLSSTFFLFPYSLSLWHCVSLSGAVNTLCFAWKLSCIMFHSLIHAYMYVNDACNFMFTHQ